MQLLQYSRTVHSSRVERGFALLVRLNTITTLGLLP